MIDKYLPIGSIVLLKDDIVMRMIIGYLNKDNEEIKEYVCIPFPYGLMSEKTLYYFNHSDIENILFIGYKNNKYEEFNLILNSDN